MLGRFFGSVKRRAQARKLADSIAQVLIAASGLFFLRDRGKEVCQRLSRDEFVLSHFYGAIAFYTEAAGVHDQETIGYILIYTFERLFPEYGKGATELCNSRLAEGRESFKNGVRDGFLEMKKLVEPEGKGLLRLLYDYLSGVQMRGGNEPRS